mgnify:CR=1 FL=1
MLHVSRVVIAIVICISAGCAIRPIPLNFSGRTTLEIVQKIRCELSEVTRQSVINLLKGRGVTGVPYPPEYNINVAPEQNPYFTKQIELAEYLTKHPFEFDTALATRAAEIHPEVRRLWRQFELTSVGLNFRFNIKEQNDTDNSVTLSDPFTRGLLSVDLNGDTDFRRETERKFVILLSAKDLYSDRVVYGCLNSWPVRADRTNIAYPITGKLGLDEVAETFLALRNFTELQVVDQATVPSLIEKLTFTTTLELGATPTITINRIGTGLNVDKINISNNNTRTDIHELTIVMGLDTKAILPRATVSSNAIGRLGRDAVTIRDGAAAGTTVMSPLATSPDQSVLGIIQYEEQLDALRDIADRPNR